MGVPPPPPVPLYDANPREFEDFLKEFFKSQLCLSGEESLEWARRFPVDGLALFRASEDDLYKVYGVNAVQLFNDLHNSPLNAQTHCQLLNMFHGTGYFFSGKPVLPPGTKKTQ